MISTAGQWLVRLSVGLCLGMHEVYAHIIHLQQMDLPSGTSSRGAKPVHWSAAFDSHCWEGAGRGERTQSDQEISGRAAWIRLWSEGVVQLGNRCWDAIHATVLDKLLRGFRIILPKRQSSKSYKTRIKLGNLSSVGIKLATELFLHRIW